MDNPFSWDYLTTRPGENEVFGPFAILYLIFFAVGFVITLIIYNGGARSIFKNPVQHRLARRWASYGLTIFGLGLFFFAIRALQISMLTFEMRIWMWLCILSFFVWIAYMIFDYQRTYPAALKEFEESQRKQQYLRAQGAGVGAAATFPAAARPVRRKRR